jgi:hypothetical protein
MVIAPRITRNGISYKIPTTVAIKEKATKGQLKMIGRTLSNMMFKLLSIIYVFKITS